MLKWAIIFLVISLIAGALGMTPVARGAATISKILFGIAIILFILFVLFIILGVIGIVFMVCIALLGLSAVTALVSLDDGNGRAWAPWIGIGMTFVVAVFGIIAIPSLITGWGLSQHKSWARILTIIVAIFSLLHFPAGTIIGVYALVIMFNDETKRILAA